MREYLTPLIQLQRFMIPGLFLLLCWAIWRTVVKKDLAVGLALYLCLVVIVDGFFNTGIYLPGLEKGSIRYSEVCGAFLLFIRPAADTRQAPFGTVRVLLGFYFAMMLVSMLRSDLLTPALFEFRRVIVPQVLALLLGLRLLRDPEQYRRFFVWLGALVFLIGIFVFWDVFFDRWVLYSDVLNHPTYSHNRKVGRFGSILLNPNYLGAFVLLLFPVYFAYSFEAKAKWPRMYCWACLLMLAFCLVQTQSRGPLLAFVLMLVVLAFGPVGSISRARRIGIFLLLSTAFLVVLPGFIERSLERFDTIQNERSEEEVSRQTTWDYTVGMIEKQPMLGIGFGEKEFFNAMLETDFVQRFGRLPLENPHNSYLQVAVYAGIPALTAFLLANVVLLLYGYRMSSGGIRSAVGPAAFGLTAGIAGFLLCIYPDMHLFTWTVAPVYWVFFGLLLSIVSSRSLRFEAGSQVENDVFAGMTRERALD